MINNSSLKIDSDNIKLENANMNKIVDPDSPEIELLEIKSPDNDNSQNKSQYGMI